MILTGHVWSIIVAKLGLEVWNNYLEYQQHVESCEFFLDIEVPKSGRRISFFVAMSSARS